MILIALVLHRLLYQSCSLRKAPPEMLSATLSQALQSWFLSCTTWWCFLIGLGNVRVLNVSKSPFLNSLSVSRKSNFITVNSWSSTVATICPHINSYLVSFVTLPVKQRHAAASFKKCWRLNQLIHEWWNVNESRPIFMRWLKLCCEWPTSMSHHIMYNWHIYFHTQRSVHEPLLTHYSQFWTLCHHLKLTAQWTWCSLDLSLSRIYLIVLYPDTLHSPRCMVMSGRKSEYNRSKLHQEKTKLLCFYWYCFEKSTRDLINIHNSVNLAHQTKLTYYTMSLLNHLFMYKVRLLL